MLDLPEHFRRRRTPRLLYKARIKLKSSLGVAVGKMGIFTSTRPGRFRSTSIKSGRLEASTQMIRPRMFGAAHLGRDHGINAAGEAGVVRAGIAFAERLIGFVDEDVTARKGVEDAKDFFQIALAAADPGGRGNL